MPPAPLSLMLCPSSALGLYRTSIPSIHMESESQVQAALPLWRDFPFPFLRINGAPKSTCRSLSISFLQLAPFCYHSLMFDPKQVGTTFIFIFLLIVQVHWLYLFIKCYLSTRIVYWRLTWFHLFAQDLLNNLLFLISLSVKRFRLHINLTAVCRV